jgi:hypothetical protein
MQDVPYVEGAFNWLTPDNYRDGRVYTRMEISGKPNNKLLDIYCGYWEFCCGHMSADGITNFTEEWMTFPEAYGQQRTVAVPWNVGPTTFYFTEIDTNGIYYFVSNGWDHVWPADVQPNWNCVGGYHCWGTRNVLPSDPQDWNFDISIQSVAVSKGSKLTIPPEFASTWTDIPPDWPDVDGATDTRHAFASMGSVAELIMDARGCRVQTTAAEHYRLCLLSANGRNLFEKSGNGPGVIDIANDHIPIGVYVLSLRNQKEAWCRRISLGE